MNFPFNPTFPEISRIERRTGYEHLFRNGNRLYTENFVIIYCNNGKGIPRYGHVVSKKVSPKAFRRNRIKRVLREIFRNNKINFDSLDILILVKRDVSRLEYRTIEKEIVGKLKSVLYKK